MVLSCPQCDAVLLTSKEFIHRYWHSLLFWHLRRADSQLTSYWEILKSLRTVTSHRVYSDRRRRRLRVYEYEELAYCQYHILLRVCGMLVVYNILLRMTFGVELCLQSYAKGWSGLRQTETKEEINEDSYFIFFSSFWFACIVYSPFFAIVYIISR